MPGDQRSEDRGQRPGGPSLTSDLRPLASVGERRLIEQIRSRLQPDPEWVHVGIGDDAAVVEGVRGALDVLTTDTMVEGVHWDWKFSSPADVGVKSLAVNLSDLASMGAEPRAALLSLCLRPAWPLPDANAFLDAFAGSARRHKVAVIGGNVTATPGPISVTVTLTGNVRRRRVLTRGGGRPGDILYVSGSVGSALAGLLWLRARGERRDEPDDAGVAECVERYRRPEARLRAGMVVGRNRAATACMDLSDGLADAVRQVAEASGTGASVDAAALPITAAALDIFRRHDQDPVRSAVAGGDDYELLFAVAPRRTRAFEAAWRQARGLAISRIGSLTLEPGLRLVRDGREEPLPEGFVHFQS